MLKKTMYPLLSVAALGLAFSFNGCSCQAEMGTPPKTAEPPPPPAPPPVPPPAPTPEPAAAAPAPAPVTIARAARFKTVGKAKIEGDQIKIPGKIEFDVDKATIRPDPGSSEILTTLTDVLKQNPNVSKIRIEGHTDNSGSADMNRALSKERAEAVAKFLTEHGVDKSRIETVGHGADKAIVPNDTPANKQMNRRTEFHIVELDGKAVDLTKALAPAAEGGGTTPPPAQVAAPVEKAVLKPGETVMKKK